LLQFVELSWEHARVYLAFGIVFIVLVHFLLGEVHAFMTQPGYFVTGSFRICQTGVFGAVGFIASGALRSSEDENTDEKMDDNIPGEPTLVMASLAFHASATAMAIVDARRRIEECNPAFVRLTSSSSDYQRCISGPVLDSSSLSAAPTQRKNKLLETALGLASGEHAERLQRCIDRCQSIENSSEGDSSIEANEDFLVHGKILNVRVSLGSGMSGDAEQAALLPFSMSGSLSKNARMASRRTAAPRRYVVVVNETSRLIGPWSVLCMNLRCSCTMARAKHS
jgi:PAS domain